MPKYRLDSSPKQYPLLPYGYARPRLIVTLWLRSAKLRLIRDVFVLYLVHGSILPPRKTSVFACFARWQ